MQGRLPAVSFALAVAAAVAELFLPVYTVGFDYRPTRTLIEVNGRWTIIPVLFPVVIALLPLIFRSRWVRITAAIVICSFGLIGSFSIGLFYLPSGAAMLVAAYAKSSGSPAGRVRTGGRIGV
jgi:hypothetical protein